MSFFRKLIFIILIISAGNFIYASDSPYKIVIQSGHNGPPADAKWHEKTRCIVSAGNDGRLIITRPSDKKVLHRFTITDNKIYSLELNPVSTQAAVVTSAGEKFTLTVWDWNKEEKKYSFQLNSEPIFVSWSARGKYIAIGNLGTPSIILLDASTGRALSYLRRLPSLYNAGYIGSTESILMTYAASGQINYWDIRTSALKLSTGTVTDLKGVTVLRTDSKTTFTAYKNNSVFLINRQNGNVEDKVEVEGLYDISVNPDSGIISVLAKTGSGYFIKTFRVINKTFTSLDTYNSAENINTPAQPVKIVRSDNSNFIITESGEIFTRKYSGFEQLVDDHLWYPDGLAFYGKSMYLTGADKILRFVSDFFDQASKTDLEDLNKIEKQEIITDSQAEHTGIITLDNGTVLQWDKEYSGFNNGIRIITSSNEKTFIQMDKPLSKISPVSSSEILTVDKNGTVSLRMFPEIKTSLLSYSTLGLMDAAYSDKNYILIGRSSRGRIGTPLEKIDASSMESVPVDDSRFMVYSISPSPSGIFTIGLEKNASGRTKTVIRLHNPDNPSISKKVIEYGKEDLRASVISDNSTVYASIGGTVYKINGSRKSVFKWDNPVSSLYIRGNILYGIDSDGAVVLWNTKNMSAVLKIYFFDDGSWLAVQPNGKKIWSSDGAVNNIGIYQNGRPVNYRRITNTGS